MIGMHSYVPGDAEMLQIAKEVKSQHLYLISNGRQSVLSPEVTPGWTVLMNPDCRRLGTTVQVAA